MIGFVSQFFFIGIGSLSSSTLGRRCSCADDGGVGARRQLRRAKAHGWMPPRGVRYDNSDSPGEGVFVDRRYRPKSGNPRVESLASPRNFINTAAAAFEGADRLCESGHPVRFLRHPSHWTGTAPTPAGRHSVGTDRDADRRKGSLTIFMESAGWWQGTRAIQKGKQQAARGRSRATESGERLGMALSDPSIRLLATLVQALSSPNEAVTPAAIKRAPVLVRSTTVSAAFTTGSW